MDSDRFRFPIIFKHVRGVKEFVHMSAKAGHKAGSLDPGGHDINTTNPYLFLGPNERPIRHAILFPTRASQS
jgi:hypothetical protein